MEEKEVTGAIDDSFATGIETPSAIVGTDESLFSQPKQSENIIDRFNAEFDSPDFGIPEVKTIDTIAKEYHMGISPAVARSIVESSGLKQSTDAQVVAGVENVLVGLAGLGDESMLAVGNIANYISGGSIGEELQNISFESMKNRYADIANREAEVGGIRSELAQLVSGATSFAELALVGLATAGTGSLAQIAAQTMGQGTYNDMQAYIDENGSLEGYRPEGSDVALNIANAIFQVGSEAILGVGSPRFFTGWSRGFWKEGASGFVQEGLQGVVSDLFEVAKDNKEYADLLDNSDQYLRDAIIGAVLQGGLGAATYGAKRARADRILAHSIAQTRGRQVPNKEDERAAKALNDTKERMYASAFTEEFKKQFDTTSPVGQLQQKVATAINDAAKAQNLDMGLSETQLAQRIEAIAAQETMNAMEDSAERRQSISVHELNNITYKDGALWLAGTTPEVGTRSIDLAKVLEQRQGLTEQRSVAGARLKTPKEITIPKNALSLETDPTITGEKKPKGTDAGRVPYENQKIKDRADDIRRAIETSGRKTGKYYYPPDEKLNSSYYFMVNGKKIRVAANEPHGEYDLWLDYKQGLEANIKTLNDFLSEDKTLKQSRPDQSRLDKGDTYRGAYDEKLKRIILNEKSDLTTIQHEFAHYWIQNNFRWYRSGLASDDWKHNWERVEQALGIEPTDKYLSKVASEKFARAYERYIMEGKVAPEYQWAFAEFQEFYNEVYEDLKAEYFDLNEELSPELIDWFNRQRPVAPEQVAEMRQNQVRSAIAQSPDNTIIESVGDGYAVVEENEQGEIESTIVVPRETITEEQFGVPAKKTKSGLQESLRKRFGDDVNVDELVALDSVETLAQAESIIASNPQLAWEQMLSDSTNDVKRAYLYKAFAKMAENDPQIAVDLSNTNMAQWAREKGQAIQALNINDELGLSPHTILAYMQNAKGKMSQEQLAQALNEIDLYAELSAEDTTSLENETECLL